MVFAIPGMPSVLSRRISVTIPVIKYKVVVLLTQVHVFLLMFEINLFWFAARNVKLAIIVWYGAQASDQRGWISVQF
jgi:hypothetical protein